MSRLTAVGLFAWIVWMLAGFAWVPPGSDWYWGLPLWLLLAGVGGAVLVSTALRGRVRPPHLGDD